MLNRPLGIKLPHNEYRECNCFLLSTSVEKCKFISNMITYYKYSNVKKTHNHRYNNHLHVWLLTNIKSVVHGVHKHSFEHILVSLPLISKRPSTRPVYIIRTIIHTQLEKNPLWYCELTERWIYKLCWII